MSSKSPDDEETESDEPFVEEKPAKKKPPKKRASKKQVKKKPEEEIDEVDDLITGLKNVRVNDQSENVRLDDDEFAKALIAKWVQAITTHMKRSRNTILRKEVAPWFEDVISAQSDALTGCYRLKSARQRKTSRPAIPSALRAALGKNLDDIPRPDLCAAIVLFYIRGWLYARSPDSSKRDYALFTGQTKKTADFNKTMANWVQDVNLKLTRHIKETVKPVENAVPLRQSATPPPSQNEPEVAGSEARKPASMRDLRKRLRQNIFVPEDDITQTEIYYPNSLINDLPNCFAVKDRKVFGSKVIADADADLQKLHASVLGVPKQYAANHDYATNVSYPSELVQELFPLKLEEFESPCAVVMLWNFYQLVKKPPDRRKILLPAGLNRQDAPEDYHTLVRPERAALLLRQAIMFYTSGYCMIQSGLKLQQSKERLVPADRGTKVVVRERAKAQPKKAKEQAPTAYTARQFTAEQKKELSELESDFQLRKAEITKFNQLFGVQKKIVAEAQKKKPQFEALVNELYAAYLAAYKFPAAVGVDGRAALVESLNTIASTLSEKDVVTSAVLARLKDNEAATVRSLQGESARTLTDLEKKLQKNSEEVAQSIKNFKKTDTFRLQREDIKQQLLRDESSFVNFMINRDNNGRVRLQEKEDLQKQIQIEKAKDVLLTRRQDQLKNRKAKSKAVRKKAPKNLPNQATLQFKGVVLGPSLIVRGFSRVFNLTNSQTIDDHKDPTQDAVMRAIQRCAIFRTPSALKVLDAERVHLAGPSPPCDILMDKTSAASALLLAFMELADYMYSPSPPLLTRAQLRTVDGYWRKTPFGQGKDYAKWSEDHQRAFRDAYRVQMKKWLNVGFQPTGERDKHHGMPLMNWDSWAPDNVRLVPNPWRVREDNYFRMLFKEFPPGMRNRLGIGLQAKTVWAKESTYGSRVAKIEPICSKDPGLYEQGSSLNGNAMRADNDRPMQSKRADMQKRVGDAIADISKHFKDDIEPQLGVYYYKTAFRVQPSTSKGTGIEVNKSCKMWGEQDTPLVTVKPPALLNLAHHPLTDVPVEPSMFQAIPNMPTEWFVYPLNRFDGGLLNGQQFRSDVSVTPRGPDGGMLTDYDITLRQNPAVWDLTVSLKKLAGRGFSCKNAVDEE